MSPKRESKTSEQGPMMTNPHRLRVPMVRWFVAADDGELQSTLRHSLSLCDTLSGRAIFVGQSCSKVHENKRTRSQSIGLTGKVTNSFIAARWTEPCLAGECIRTWPRARHCMNFIKWERQQGLLWRLVGLFFLRYFGAHVKFHWIVTGLLNWIFRSSFVWIRSLMHEKT